MAAPVMSMRVSISVSCSKLLNKDLVGRSDPMVVMFMRSNPKTSFAEVGRTERIKDTLDPKFVKTFEVDYFFEATQELQFRVYDVDSKGGADLGDQDFLGEMFTTLGEVCGSRGMTLTRGLKKPSHGGEVGGITVSAEQVRTATADALHVRFAGRKLDKKDFMGLGRPDPFFVVSKMTAAGAWAPVHKSEYIDSTQEPEWKEACLPIKELCNGELERPIRIEVFDYDNDGGHDLVGATEGAAQTTTRALIERTWPGEGMILVSEKKKAKKGADYKGSGFLLLVNSRLERVYSFLDYLAGGCELSLVVAVDFTGSNGDPRSRDSLHYMGGAEPNQYAQALGAVGSILENYDYDRMFHAYGFGGCLPGTSTASHCFALNGNPNQPEVPGVPGILAAYKQAINVIGLSGPTFFAPTIKMATSVAAAAADGGRQKYTILLILTDGAINDLAETREALAAACNAPLSIIIVGVGSADFDSMELLDGDDAPKEKEKGKKKGKGQRDIVQFVPYRQFAAAGPPALAAAVLAEVPGQLVEFYRLRNIVPNPPVRPQGAPPAPGPGPAAPVPQMQAMKI